MQESQNNQKKEQKNFLKKNGYYFILAGIVLVLALVIGLTSMAGNNTSKPTEEVNGGKITFVCPVANASIAKGFSATELQYNAALNEWAIHKAIDFVASSGANVMASYDGTVESVSTNILDGTCVVINHGGNLKTVYKSLAENVKVKVGDKVTTGQVIGYVSNSATSENTDSSRLHYEVWKDDAKVDPAGYLDIDSK